jgi:hypothetical protein
LWIGREGIADGWREELAHHISYWSIFDLPGDVSGIVSLAVALEMIAMTFSTRFLLHGYTFGKALNVFWRAWRNWFSASIGLAVWGWASATHCEDRLVSRRMDFSVGIDKAYGWNNFSRGIDGGGQTETHRRQPVLRRGRKDDRWWSSRHLRFFHPKWLV